MDGVVREMNVRIGKVGVDLCVDNKNWKLNTILFADEFLDYRKRKT